MNERTFGQPPQQLPSRDKGLEQQERRAIRVEDWARENNHEALLRYIKSSEQTNSNVGLLPENMYYDPEKKTMTLTVPYHRSHAGWGAGGFHRHYFWSLGFY